MNVPTHLLLALALAAPAAALADGAVTLPELAPEVVPELVAQPGTSPIVDVASGLQPIANATPIVEVVETPIVEEIVDWDDWDCDECGMG